jgi:EAL domain-containing protein (putative c-di-GMP-specific phosphodiesterase class I)
MPLPRPYVFALQMKDPDRFINIFGPAFAAVVWVDIIRGVTRITDAMLRGYDILADVRSSAWGRCFRPFRPRPSSLPVDMDEQVGALAGAGRQLIREMLQKNLGAATGSQLDFSLLVTPVSGDVTDAAVIDLQLDSRFDSLPYVGLPALGLTRDEFGQILAQEAVEIYLQPIVALPAENVVGFEALSRGAHSGTLHPADLLFGTAARWGLTEQLELICIAKALDTLPALPAEYWMSINIGPALLKSEAFAALVFQEHLSSCWPRIVFELTEHLPIDSVLELQATVQRLKNHGMCLSLDDTGCGFFDLHTAESFRPRIVKLCITIIRRIDRSAETFAEFSETVSRLSEFGEHILGEGVEDRAQLDVLNQCGVSMAQGYYFDKPRPAGAVLKELSERSFAG